MTARVWAIGGFDPSGGAGVIADGAVLQALSVPAATLITAVTAQNQHRFLSRQTLSPAWLRRQAEAVLEDGRPSAIKIGMLGSAAMGREVARLIDQLPGVRVVLDPVLRASAGPATLDPDGIRVLREWLIPRSMLVKPNRREAEALLGRRIPHRPEALRRAARELRGLGAEAVIITTGDDAGPPQDFLVDSRGEVAYARDRIEVRARGTGCRFTTAVAAGLALGLSLRRSIGLARRSVRDYLRRQLSAR